MCQKHTFLYTAGLKIHEEKPYFYHFSAENHQYNQLLIKRLLFKSKYTADFPKGNCNQKAQLKETMICIEDRLLLLRQEHTGKQFLKCDRAPSPCLLEINLCS